MSDFSCFQSPVSARQPIGGFGSKQTPNEESDEGPTPTDTTNTTIQSTPFDEAHSIMTHSTVVEGDWNHSTGGEDEIEFEIEHHPHRQSPTQPNPSTTSDMTYQQEEKQENASHQLSSHSHSHYLPPPSSSSALLPSSSHYGYSAEDAPTPATRPESTATTTAALSPPPTAHAHERPTYAYNRASFASSPVPTPTPPPAVAFTDVQAIDQAARAAIESQDDHIVSQFIQLLEKHREECERKHKYVDAEVAKNKIEQLRQQSVTHNQAKQATDLGPIY